MLDPDLLHCFAIVVETGSFTRAAERMNTVQSAVSAKVKRLEERAGRQLLKRTTRGMTLTQDGETMLAFAREMSQLQDSARLRFSAPTLEGIVRLGTSDDIASGRRMVQVLGEFTRLYPRVTLEIEVGNSQTLGEEIKAGHLDIVLSKRRTATGGGRLLWSEPIVWTGGKTIVAHYTDCIPLALFPSPCLYREVVLSALLDAGRQWRVVLTSSSLAGIKSAVANGLAVTGLPMSMVTSELCILEDLPPLSPAEFILHTQPRASKATQALASLLIKLSPDGTRVSS